MAYAPARVPALEDGVSLLRDVEDRWFMPANTYPATQHVEAWSRVPRPSEVILEALGPAICRIPDTDCRELFFHDVRE